jgi:CrcB protein
LTHHHDVHDLPVDPDVERATAPHLSASVLLVIGLGGAVGSLARWSLGEWLAGRFPWATLVENVTGGLALGVLMVLVVEVWPSSRHLRTFVGVGVLGGWTTFSTFALDVRRLLADGEPALASLYLLGTLVAGLAAVWAGIALTEKTLDRVQP